MSPSSSFLTTVSSSAIAASKSLMDVSDIPCRVLRACENCHVFCGLCELCGSQAPNVWFLHAPSGSRVLQARSQLLARRLIWLLVDGGSHFTVQLSLGQLHVHLIARVRLAGAAQDLGFVGI